MTTDRYHRKTSFICTERQPFSQTIHASIEGDTRERRNVNLIVVKDCGYTVAQMRQELVQDFRVSPSPPEDHWLILFICSDWCDHTVSRLLKSRYVASRGDI